MKLTSLLLFCLISLNIFAQKKNAGYQYHIHRATSPIKIDGDDNDVAWQTAEVAKDFHMVLPMDTSLAKVPTTVRMAYDDNNVYIIAVC